MVDADGRLPSHDMRTKDGRIAQTANHAYASTNEPFYEMVEYKAAETPRLTPHSPTASREGTMKTQKGIEIDLDRGNRNRSRLGAVSGDLADMADHLCELAEWFENPDKTPIIQTPNGLPGWLLRQIALECKKYAQAHPPDNNQAQVRR